MKLDLYYTKLVHFASLSNCLKNPPISFKNLSTFSLMKMTRTLILLESKYKSNNFKNVIKTNG